MPGGVGVARQRADAGKCTGLVRGAVAAMEKIGVGREVVEQPGEATSREAVAAADARTLLELDGFSEAVRGEDLASDLE